MHARQAALTGGTIFVLMWLSASTARAEKDAAIKAREGDVNHWIEYYRKNQQPPQPAAQAPQAAGQEREKRKEEREKRKWKAKCERAKKKAENNLRFLQP